MTPNDDSRDEELLARYRRAGADAPVPSDAVRAAILAEGRRVADELAKRAPQHIIDVSRPAANDSRWKIPVFGTVGAALLAALLFAPRYWENAPPAQVKAPASVPAAAPARQAPSDAASLQEIVVTQADRKSAKVYGAPLPNPPAPAPALPPNATRNYAPVSPSLSPLAAAPPVPAPRARASDLSARAAETHSPSAGADRVVGGFISKPATLQAAVAQGDVAQTASLLDQGAVIDARDEAGRTPLMLAVTQDRIEIVRLLLGRGADPNAADNAGHTPLQQATIRNLPDVAALLEQAGAH
jgi:hypothetical protein